MKQEKKDNDNQVDSLLTEIANWSVVATIAICIVILVTVIFKVSTGL